MTSRTSSPPAGVTVVSSRRDPAAGQACIGPSASAVWARRALSWWLTGSVLDGNPPAVMAQSTDELLFRLREHQGRSEWVPQRTQMSGFAFDADVGGSEGDDCNRCTADANPRDVRNRSRATSSKPKATLQIGCLPRCKLYVCTASFLKLASLCRQSRRQCICHWQTAQCALDSHPLLKTSQASASICLPCWWSIRRQHLFCAWLEPPWWSTGLGTAT